MQELWESHDELFRLVSRQASVIEQLEQRVTELERRQETVELADNIVRLTRGAVALADERTVAQITIGEHTDYDHLGRVVAAKRKLADAAP